ncbi:unknown [Clostridium sp. CAG:354]|nr:unknown [Clostridium sp. CAG:354]
MDKKDLKKQVILLSIFLLIVIIVAVFVNIFLNNKEQTNTEINSNTVTDLNGNQTNMQDVKINGFTKQEIENMKPLLNPTIYSKYMETFEALENGSIPYQENFKLNVDELENTADNNTVDNTTSSINEAEQNGDYSYLTINGEQTDIKVYDNVEGD